MRNCRKDMIRLCTRHNTLVLQSPEIVYRMRGKDGMNYIEQLGKAAKASKKSIATAGTAKKNEVLEKIIPITPIGTLVFVIRIPFGLV